MPDRRVPGIWEYDRADAHGSSGPLDRDGENEFALGTVPAQPVGTVSLPRHAQPGIHEYTAQTLAGG
jgi:hypothetical protein